MDKKLALFIVGAFVMLILIVSTVTIIGPGTRGVVTTFGKVQPGVLDEGIHFVKPFMDRVTKMNVRYVTSDIKSSAGSKDMQTVNFTVAVTWKLNPMAVNTVFQTIGDEEAVLGNILDPAVYEVVKASTAKMTAEEVLTKRSILKEAIDTALKSRAVNYGIELDQVSIKDIDFSKEYSEAIEAKQIAEQNARKAAYDADRAKQEALSEVNRAKGTAEAQRLMRDTISPKLIARQAVEKWDGHMPDVLIMGKDNGGNMLFNIPVKNKSSSEASE